jgi:hypothetical protein
MARISSWSHLLHSIEVSGELGELFILGCDSLWRRWLQELMRAIKFVPVGLENPRGWTLE